MLSLAQAVYFVWLHNAFFFLILFLFVNSFIFMGVDLHGRGELSCIVTCTTRKQGAEDQHTAGCYHPQKFWMLAKSFLSLLYLWVLAARTLQGAHLNSNLAWTELKTITLSRSCQCVFKPQWLEYKCASRKKKRSPAAPPLSNTSDRIFHLRNDSSWARAHAVLYFPHMWTLKINLKLQ